MQRVLVTGAFGQLGCDLLPLLSDYEVLATDLKTPAGTGSASYQMQQLNIAEIDAVRLTVDEFRPQVVINLAAMTNVDGCENDPHAAFAINAGAVSNFTLALADSDCHFVQISTDYLFDGSAGPYGEDAPPSPVNEYGKTKLAGEQALGKADFPVTIIRTNVVFGGNTNTRASFVKWVVDSLRDGRQINIVADQWNNPAWTIGLSETICYFIREKTVGIYNYGSSNYLSRLDFAREIANVFDLDQELLQPITTAELKQRARRPLRGGVKIDKLIRETGVKPYSTYQALRQIRIQDTL